MRHWRLALSLAALAGLTLGLKIGLHGSLSPLDETRAGQLETEQVLTGTGWVRQQTISLTIDNSLSATRYTHEGCADGITVAVAPPRADAFPLIGELARDGDHVFFVHDGHVLDRPPSNAALLRWKFARILQVFRGVAASSPILAIVVPPACPPARDIPWLKA